MRMTKKPQKAKKKETKGGVFSVVEAEQKKSELWLKGHGRRQKAESRSSNVYRTYTATSIQKMVEYVTTIPTSPKAKGSLTASELCIIRYNIYHNISMHQDPGTEEVWAHRAT